MVQETTSGLGDQVGSANPTRSKLRQCASEGGPPEHTGRALEAVGNGCPRWMAVTATSATTRGTEPGLQADSSHPSAEPPRRGGGREDGQPGDDGRQWQDRGDDEAA